MSEMTLLRVGIAVAVSLLLGAIIYFGRVRKQGQGRRVPKGADGDAHSRVDPTLGEQLADSWGQQPPEQAELPVAPPADPHAQLGKRLNDEFDRIVTLYVAAKAGTTLRGQDIVVAAEKAGLVFGYMDVFHRLADGKPEIGPIFSVANIVKPGSFDMANVADLETPAIAFFLTLPAPIAALDAWETMEPAAQRMAQLLDGVVLDEERSALGRQRVQYIRDELRAYDRQNVVPVAGKPTRW